MRHFVMSSRRLFMIVVNKLQNRVGQGAFAPFPPSEPYLTLSRHTAQASRRRFASLKHPRSSTKRLSELKYRFLTLRSWK